MRRTFFTSWKTKTNFEPKKKELYGQGNNKQKAHLITLQHDLKVPSPVHSSKTPLNLSFNGGGGGKENRKNGRKANLTATLKHIHVKTS